MCKSSSRPLFQELPKISLRQAKPKLVQVKVCEIEQAQQTTTRPNSWKSYIKIKFITLLNVLVVAFDYFFENRAYPDQSI
jgi:hypothetical protein